MLRAELQRYKNKKRIAVIDLPELEEYPEAIEWCKTLFVCTGNHIKGDTPRAVYRSVPTREDVYVVSDPLNVHA